MKITTITYSRTRNLGKYNSVKVEASIEVDEEESDADEAYQRLREWVLFKLDREQAS